MPAERRRKGAQLYRLTLGDGTQLVLPCPRAEPCRELVPALDGARLVVRGVVHDVAHIPVRYGIVQSVAAPYLVEWYGFSR